MNNKNIQALINSGADATKNMYDVLHKWPWADTFDGGVSVRQKGVNIPEASTETYDVSYQGVTMKRAATKVNMERTFEITYRLDAAYEQYGKFIKWHSYTSNPVTGQVGNTPLAIGSVKVVAPKGQYNAYDLWNGSTTNGASGRAEKMRMVDEDTSTKDAAGHVLWEFDNVWVFKVTQPAFSPDGGDALEFTVGYAFGDVDYPEYGTNKTSNVNPDLIVSTASMPSK
jgi:hypothetical protein